MTCESLWWMQAPACFNGTRPFLRRGIERVGGDGGKRKRKKKRSGRSVPAIEQGDDCGTEFESALPLLDRGVEGTRTFLLLHILGRCFQAIRMGEIE